LRKRKKVAPKRRGSLPSVNRIVRKGIKDLLRILLFRKKNKKMKKKKALLSEERALGGEKERRHNKTSRKKKRKESLNFPNRLHGGREGHHPRTPEKGGLRQKKNSEKKRGDARFPQGRRGFRLIRNTRKAVSASWKRHKEV